MKVPRLFHAPRRNVAAIVVSYGTIWHSEHTRDLKLSYNAAGRLVRVMFTDPRSQLPCSVGLHEACVIAAGLLAADCPDRHRELQVLRSAANRTRQSTQLGQ